MSSNDIIEVYAELPSPLINPDLQLAACVWTCTRGGVRHRLESTCDCDASSSGVESPMSAPWPCGNCLHTNAMTNRCVLCGLNVHHSWTCVRCSHTSNDGSKTVCSGCSERRCPSAVLDIGTSAEVKSCGDCGAVNATSRDACYSCKEEL